MAKVYVENNLVRQTLRVLDLVGEVLDVKEGSLLDSLLYDTGDCLVACIERFQTSWTSAYDMYVANKNDESAMSELEREWELYCDWYEKEFGEEED